MRHPDRKSGTPCGWSSRVNAQGLRSRTSPKKWTKRQEKSKESTSADFSGASPVASALGLPLGRDPSRKIEKKTYNKASDVASNNNALSTTGSLRAAAIRNAVMASLFTLRGTPLVA